MLAPHLPGPDAVLLDESQGGMGASQVDIQTVGATGAPTSVTTTSNKRSRKDNGSPVLDVEGITTMEHVKTKVDAVNINPARKRIKKNPCVEDLRLFEITSASNTIWPAGGDPNHKLKITSALNQEYWPPSMIDNREPLHVQFSQILAAINNAVLPQIELMSRSITDLHRVNKRLIKTLSDYGIKHSAHDKLVDSSIAPLVPPQQPAVESLPKPVPMEMNFVQVTRHPAMDP